MTYDARERSLDAGAPFELFEFVRGVRRWRYTSRDRSVTWSANLFESVAISRSRIESGQELARQSMRITAPRELAVAELYRGAPPSDPIQVTIWQSHDGDPDGEFVVVWQGRIVNVTFGGATAEIDCESVYTSLRRVGLRRAWQRLCPHVLYGPECRVVRASYQVNAVVASVSGATIGAAAFGSFGAGYLLGGFLEWVTPDAVTERRPILSHGTTEIAVDRPIPGLAVGASVAVFPGCDHTTGAGGCARFGNLPNYGGMPYIPTKNPFGGDPIY